MKTIKFEKSKDNPNHYLPLTTDLSDWDKDHSGTYVLASEAQERERVLVEALKEIIDYSDGQTRPDAEYMCDIARAALAAVEGRKP